MTLLHLADADPDPTTQIPWPCRHGRRTLNSQDISRSHCEENVVRCTTSASDIEIGKRLSSKDELDGRRLTTWNLITLSIAMAGSQIAWTVELGYGTPFLLSLGLSEQLTSLVWLAGPISGLITQPVVGAISDSSSSKYRRRSWIASSTMILVLSTLCLAYCQSISAFFVDLLGGGEGDWDPRRIKEVSGVAIGLAIFSFYLLDFSLNALQASLRNLLLDITPPEQLNAGNAWHGRMTHAGNIIGFGFGFLPLAKLPALRWLGGDQFRKFCVVAMIMLVATVWVTCWCHEEKARKQVHKKSGKVFEILENIFNAIINLPWPIRQVCYGQVFAFMGWFPFLFYATTYVGQIMAFERNEEPDKDVATRAGELAMLVYSIVAVAAGSLLPHLAGRDPRLLALKCDEDGHTEQTQLQASLYQWRAEADQHGRVLRLPMRPFLLRDIWTGALVLFAIITFSTFFISSVSQATIAIGLIGICWAIAIWVPFALVMEFLKELESAPDIRSQYNTTTRTTCSPIPSNASNPSPPRNENEYQPLLSTRSSNEYLDTAGDSILEPTPVVAGGTILGIHNLAIVFPQFIIALVSSAIFRAVDADIDDDLNNNTYLGKNGVAWVLRFGGLCSLMGALIVRKVPLTQTEKQIRRLLRNIRELSQDTP